ncbi:glutathione S-transferase like protein [Phyllosticta citriasiana]|uniref:Glutathione S-transferase like protein n=1 Tax=Phyllosticta citriasiana TaxID=595635 RepID=A0ABR1KBU9_9PEZI
MTITIHHLQRSQSERVVWLAEELGIPYEIKIYQRDRQTLLAPPELKAISPAGTSPVMQDGAICMSESAAIMEYLMTKHAAGRMSVPPSAPNYTDYIFWFHWGIGTLQPTIQMLMFMRFAGVAASENPIIQAFQARVDLALKMLDDRLRKSTWLAGDEFTAADIMCAFGVTTMRLFCPFSLEGYEGILGFLSRIAERPAYKATIEKAESGETMGVVPTLMKEAPEPLKTF